METNLTIVVLAYNSAHIIENCLSKINFDKYKVVVVDNASRDGSAKLIEEKFPRAQLIKLPQNIGYGRGNNVALEQVTTEFALVLNPDAIILEKDIEIILEEMRRDKSIGLAGPLLLEKFPLDGEELREKLQNFNHSVQGQIVAPTYGRDFLVGAVLFMRTAFFKKVGFFDKNIFLYYEDDEICKRVLDNGFRNVIVPAAVAFHMEGKSSSSKSPFRAIYKKSWHLKGWSKLYWKELRQGKVRAKKSALKMILVHFASSFLAVMRFDWPELAKHLGTLSGSFSYLIGLKAFNKNGASRG